MATTITNDLRITNAKNLIASLWDTTNENTFLAFGRTVPWPNDDNPPLPRNNLQDEYATKYQTLAIEKVDKARAYHLIRKNIWTSGTVYDYYRHDYSYDNVSANRASNLYDAKFVVMNSKFQVFVCLWNGTGPSFRTGKPSVDQPEQSSSINYSPFYTTDGYQWLYLYTLTDTMKVDATATAIPINLSYPSEEIMVGPVNTIIVTNSGTNYVAPERYYFCNIVGDGKEGIARIRSNGSSFDSVQVIDAGKNYTYANIDFTPNRIYTSIRDLRNRQNGVDLRGNGDFRTTCIISPEGGWGSDLISQLGGTKVGFFITSGYVNDVSYMDANDEELSFRQISLLNTVTIPPIEGVDMSTKLRLDGTHAMNLIITGGPGFQLLEEIRQSYIVDGVPVVARGMIVGWNYLDSVRVLRYIQDPNYHCHTDGDMWPFFLPTPKKQDPTTTDSPSYIITGVTSKTTAKMDYTTFGLLDDRYFNFGYSAPEYDKTTGNVLYISNISPVAKISQQSEEVSIVIAY
jgi:hypothetical protein